MKPHALIAISIGLCALPGSATSVSLSGTVLDQDSTARSGVVVSLSGTSLTATTGTDGTWSLGGTTGLGSSPSNSPSKTSTRHVVMDGGRLRLSIGEYDIDGRPLASQVGTSSVSFGRSARVVSSTLDTLIYSWNGTVILRDTIGDDGHSHTGILRFFDTTINAAITYGYVSDAQGHLYRTTTIGSQIWMAQNLNYKVDSSWCYSGVKDSCTKYGRLYQWAAAMDTSITYITSLLNATLPSQGICPTGWHVPSDAEWTKLTDTTLSSSTAGTVLKSTSGWNTNTGTDVYGFGLLPAGYRYNVWASYGAGEGAYLWSSSEPDASDARVKSFAYGSANASRYYEKKSVGFSLRCLKDQ